ncbi:MULTISPECIES: hypothetical protein [Methylobacterium]|uniref:hypothetical protein n=1 Tax=Methylobacterium TaxID=407 RepID=UPI00272E1B2F|nr:hypothetical protein [Methylobacterium sp.]
MNGWLAGLAEALTPWKEVLGSAFAALAAMGAVVGAVLKGRRAPDATFPEPALPGGRYGTVRLHPDDHEAVTALRGGIGDLREAVEDLARVTRQNTRATDENTEGRARP